MKTTLTIILITLAAMVPVVNYAVIPACLPPAKALPVAEVLPVEQDAPVPVQAEIQLAAKADGDWKARESTQTLPTVEQGSVDTRLTLAGSRGRRVVSDGKDFKQVIDAKDKEVMPTPTPPLELPKPPVFVFVPEIPIVSQ